MTDAKFDATATGQMLYYARRSGYLEGALWVIAQGTSGVDPQVAAQRALDGVGEDWLVNGRRHVTKPMPKEKRA